MCVPPGVQESVWGCGGAGEGILGGERASERGVNEAHTAQEGVGSRHRKVRHNA